MQAFDSNIVAATGGRIVVEPGDDPPAVFPDRLVARIRVALELDDELDDLPLVGT